MKRFVKGVVKGLEEVYKRAQRGLRKVMKGY
jgi:hypothetical protein